MPFPQALSQMTRMSMQGAASLMPSGAVACTVDRAEEEREQELADSLALDFGTPTGRCVCCQKAEFLHRPVMRDYPGLAAEMGAHSRASVPRRSGTLILLAQMGLDSAPAVIKLQA